MEKKLSLFSNSAVRDTTSYGSLNLLVEVVIWWWTGGPYVCCERTVSIDNFSDGPVKQTKEI